ncbi:ABC transporter, ATP-binding protein [Acidipropionibacterium acidipropionici ATCC 4875]|uniref:ABC transporter, ATP-binding protein n=1 Tax=Acidipropionibacterium acidipropionici (strain ATCC 4875 / DSM 20272 / JCM 6432 / NBRC 12425 / NCIMB 8070 / 4) TaxID=1171373 RepID=K7RNX2_ACIA4|nr:ABC transporter ATP-binding protein [Acidipropionibacterium acidipropionici]AFV87996.1 ABC transporter, ATP-binding protein [Acidipropionibacterium acidipropionici ATCC 4875]
MSTPRRSSPFEPPVSDPEPEPQGEVPAPRRGLADTPGSLASSDDAHHSSPVPRPGSAHAAAPTAPSPAVAASPDPAQAASAGVRLTKVYGTGDTQVTALDGVSVGFARGSFSAIMGPSGSGKSTLMHCLAGLDRITSGSVFLAGTELSSLPDKQLTRARRDQVGFIFQSFNLLPTLTAKQNILLPLDLAGAKADPELFTTLVEGLGIADRLTHRPSELSGGQQQRVACARAMITRPSVVFADEPTGALDSKSGTALLDYLRHCATDLGQTIIMVTHDARAASYADRVLMLLDGHIVDDIASPTAEAVSAAMAGLEA